MDYLKEISELSAREKLMLAATLTQGIMAGNSASQPWPNYDLNQEMAKVAYFTLFEVLHCLDSGSIPQKPKRDVHFGSLL